VRRVLISVICVVCGCSVMDPGNADSGRGAPDAARVDAPAALEGDAAGSSPDAGRGLDDAFAAGDVGAVIDAGEIDLPDAGDMRPDAPAPGGLGEASWRTVRTFAGSGARGSADGAAASASFSDPAGLAFDATGSLIVVDRGTGRLRRVSPDGSVSTVSLSGGSLRGPFGIAVARDGSWLVSDSDDSCIRRISDGAITTYAGLCGTRGSSDGDARAARFDRPRHLALDGSGALWVADAQNHTLRRVDSDGTVSTYAGTAGVAGFVDADRPGAIYFPWALAASPDGVWVGGQDSCVRAVTDTRVTRLAGACANFGNTGHVDGDGASARFDWIKGMTLAPWGTAYVADAGNDAIRAIDADGTVRTIAGATSEFVDGALGVARFRGPTGLAVGPDGALYVADTDNQRIRRIAE